MPETLTGLSLSALCDADKSLIPLDPALRLLAGPARMNGRVRTVLAPGDHLPVLRALGTAQPGEVLVVATAGADRAVAGELFATEARRRGLAGLVVDGLVRDLAGLRDNGLPVWARGTSPASGATVDVADPPGAITCGGRHVRDGDVVLADDDGVLIAPEARLRVAAERATAIEAAEAAVLEGLAQGKALGELTNLRDHVAALRDGRVSALEFRPG